jgi:hypothetical protein
MAETLPVPSSSEAFAKVLGYGNAVGHCRVVGIAMIRSA